MQTLKPEAINAISTLPDDASIDDIMYRLYIINKVSRSKEEVKKGKTITVDELRREIQFNF